MKKILLPLLLLTPFFALAQTKKIAHRSHAGKSPAFSTTASHDDFGLRSSDFERTAENAPKKDSTKHNSTVATKDSSRKTGAAQKPRTRKKR